MSGRGLKLNVKLTGYDRVVVVTTSSSIPKADNSDGP